jgi:hypothetical protein
VIDALEGQLTIAVHLDEPTTPSPPPCCRRWN